MSSLLRYRRLRLTGNGSGAALIVAEGPRSGYWWQVERLTLKSPGNTQAFIFVAPEDSFTAGAPDFSWLVDEAVFTDYSVGEYPRPIYVPQRERFIVLFSLIALGVQVNATLQVREYGPTR